MGCGKRVKAVRILLKLKQKELAMQMNISNSYLCGVESEIKQANAEIIFTLINKFDVNPAWLQNGTGKIFSSNGQYVFVGGAQVSEPLENYNIPISKNYVEKDLNIESDKLNYYIIQDENMNPTIHKGDIVFVNKSDNNSENEGIYLFETDEKKFVRRLVLIPEKHLVNDNHNFIHGSILLDCTIRNLGRVVLFCRKI